jgi:flagellar biosynthesis/type III secretory pathway protein FliH
MEKNAATEEEVQALHTELEVLKKEFSARISAMEALLPKKAEAAEEHISAEMLAMIAAAVTAFLGKKVKIRSAHLIPTVNTWAQAGRVVVQASHNLKR